ncbi:hypothetical protein MAUB1S_08122 [Mycolicibacterium aubagnense]
MTRSIGWLAAAMLCLAGPAHATDADFLKSLAGSWGGKGTVKTETGSKPIKINCSFASRATDISLSLNGKCTGYVVFSRAIGADVKTDGKTYTGIYTGSKTGPAGLRGKRANNALVLGIRWAKEVNGDRAAELRLEKLANNRMRLTTTDKDPATGKNVVISQIDLNRS